MLIFAMLTACNLDLPNGWEDAKPVDDLQQAACAGSPYGDTGDTGEGTGERVEASASGDGVAVSYLEAHFRCAQDVAGWYRSADGEVDALVQPRDMNPRSVAGCDCLYNITFSVPVATPTTLTLYRRWDNINDPNDPVLIGSVDVN